MYVYISQILLLVINFIPFGGAKNTCKIPVTNAFKFWSKIFLISVSHTQNRSKFQLKPEFLSILVAPFVSVIGIWRIPPFFSRIKGIASGTEMTGRELHRFFHFDMPPYIVILLLSINIAVIVNECNNWSFLLLWGQ